MDPLRRLSKRLRAMIDCLDSCELLADIGTDHGHLPAAAVILGVAKSAIASDLRSDPLEVAAKTIKYSGLKERVQLIQADGLAGLRELAVDALTIAGMTGGLMTRICQADLAVLNQVKQIVVQPNSGAEHLRKFMAESGFHLVKEFLLQENNRHFLICSFAQGEGADQAYENLTFSKEEAYFLGPLLLSSRCPIAHAEFVAQLARLESLKESGGKIADSEVSLYHRAIEATRIH